MAPSTFRAFETRKTRWAYTIATGITNIPGPILREFFSATHTWNKHKQTSFKLINLDCKDKHFPSIHQGFEGKNVNQDSSKQFHIIKDVINDLTAVVSCFEPFKGFLKGTSVHAI